MASIKPETPAQPVLIEPMENKEPATSTKLVASPDAAPAIGVQGDVDHSVVTEEDKEKMRQLGIDVSQISFRHAPVLAELPKKKTNPTEFEYAEHAYLGDTITLKMANGTTQAAWNAPFTLPNGVRVTYGQINALAGDLYGTNDPISDGGNMQEQMTRFQAAYNKLAQNVVGQPLEANALIQALRNEVDKVNQAVREGRDPSVVYTGIDNTAALEAITIQRNNLIFGGGPTYIQLARINWDHFGDDARIAYNAGHLAALQVAVRGTPQDLLTAYSMNAFADHFLEDSFSAGHIRTPRRQLHGIIDFTADRCAQYMHAEDNAIGLDVQNPRGETWHVYGDKRALDVVARVNQTKCREAVQLSADEIYNAWRTRIVPAVSSFGAWNIAPTLASARGPQTLSPLFKWDGTRLMRRLNLEDRTVWTHTSDFTFIGTTWRIETSGLWKEPIHL